MTSSPTPFHRFVDRFQYVVLAATAGALVCLFALGRSPTPGGAAATDGPGAAVFAERCAGCHGSEGQGGGVGPPLAGRMETEYPDIADQIAVVANGRGVMPAFADRLSSDEIAAVVDFTRTTLG